MEQKKSPSQKRREKEKQFRQESILEAAKKIFLQKGFHKATMDEIALEAEITKPTLYQYFKAKDELYFAITRPLMDMLFSDMETMNRKMDEGEYSSGKEIITDHFDTYKRILNKDYELFLIFMIFNQTYSHHDFNQNTLESVAKSAGERYRGMRSLYTKAIEKGMLQDVNVYHLVDMIWGSFQGIVQSLSIKDHNKNHKQNLINNLNFAQETIITAVTKGS